MKLRLTATAALFLLFSVDIHAQESEKPTLTAVTVSNETYVGILKEPDSRVSDLLLEDLTTGKVLELKPAEVKRNSTKKPTENTDRQS